MSPSAREVGLPRVALVTTGGTLQMSGLNRLDLAHYAEEVRPLTPAELLARVPEINAWADVELVDFGWHRALGPAEWPHLARTLHRLLEDEGFDGVAVTHGTNTLEETAYFLNLTVATRKPIVLAGSMRPPSAASSDTDLNLLRALQTASSPRAAGLGVLVLLNDTVHAARDVTKTTTYRLHAFVSPDTGPLGYADSDGQLVILRKPVRRHTWRSTFRVDELSRLPRVDVSVSYPGQDGVAIDAYVAAGASGIVLAGSGASGRTDDEDAAIDRALERHVSVVLSSRTGSGRVVASDSEIARGLVGGGDLRPWKARVLLMLALTTRRRSPRQIQSLFDQY